MKDFIEISFLDIETTGKLDINQEIIEICISKYLYNIKLHTKIKISTQVWRIKPNKNIEAKAQAVHGITMECLKHERNKSQVLPEVLDFLSATDLYVAHNGREFDIPFIEKEMISVGLVLKKTPLFDTMLEGRWATPWGKVPNLGELAFACNQEYDPSKAHSAEYDVNVMAECFFYALEHDQINIDKIIEL